MPCSRGVPAPRGSAPGGACSGGVPALVRVPALGRVPAPVRVPALGGGVCSRGCLLPGGLGDPPESRWLLLRTVRILLECILVSSFIFKKKELSPN